MTNLQGEEWAGSKDPRGARPAITPGRLEAIWPEARARVIRSVAGRGADPQTAEDIAQEVALRAIDHGVPFHDVDDFCGWAYRVARNLYVDHARSRGRLVGLVDLPDQADGRDLHGEVEHRLALGTTLRALKTLDQGDRAAIVAGVNETVEPTRKAAVRMAVRRHRARARLLRLVEGIAAFWAFMRASRRSLHLTPVAAVAACGVLVAVPVIDRLDGSPSAPGSRLSPPTRVGVTAARPDVTNPRQPGTSTVQAQLPAQPAGPEDVGADTPNEDQVLFSSPTGQTVGTGSNPEPEKRCAIQSGSADKCHLVWPTVPTRPDVDTLLGDQPEVPS